MESYDQGYRMGYARAISRLHSPDRTGNPEYDRGAKDGFWEGVRTRTRTYLGSKKK